MYEFAVQIRTKEYGFFDKKTAFSVERKRGLLIIRLADIVERLFFLQLWL